MESRRHLQQEIKDELDLAAAHVKRTEESVMDLEFDYNERVEDMADGPGKDPRIAALMKEKEIRQEALGLDKAYAVQKRAARDFALISRVYEIGCSPATADSKEDRLADFLFDASGGVGSTPRAAAAVDRLVEALKAYLQVSLNDDNDRNIRRAWAEIGELLKLPGPGD